MIGQSIPRKEDARLLTGGGRYLDDHTRPGLLHVGIVRSPHAHARVVRIAGEKALLSSGVIGVYSTAELPRLANPIPPYRTIRKFRVHAQPVLANAVVRYVGEPVAVVVAANVDALLLAMDRVEIEYAPLPEIGRASCRERV